MQKFGLIPSKRQQVSKQAVSTVFFIRFLQSLFSVLPLAFWLLTLRFPSLISQSLINKRITFKWHLLSNMLSLSWNAPWRWLHYDPSRKISEPPKQGVLSSAKKAFGGSCVALGGKAEEEGEWTTAIDQNCFYFILFFLRLGMMTHVCNPSIWKGKEGERRSMSFLAT